MTPEVEMLWKAKLADLAEEPKEDASHEHIL